MPVRERRPIAVRAADLVAVDEALYGAHAEVGQLDVEETASLRELLRRTDHGVIQARPEVGELERLHFGHGVSLCVSRPLAAC